jgi:hypothetical protein
MTDILPPDQENHHFGDIGRMIANTFKMLGDENELHRA